MKIYIRLFVITLGLGFGLNAYSDDLPVALKKSDNVVQFKNIQEKKQFDNTFTISFYEPTYILPISYSSALKQVDIKNNPEQNKLKHLEFNFKISFKVPVIESVFHKDNALYLAYTQLSYWQAYNNSSFFRENNYKPEVFFSNNINLLLGKDWRLQLLNVGFVHESNGYSDPIKRSWNRVYLEGVLSKQNWMISVRPWYAISDRTSRLYHNDITRYLGNGRLVIAYNYHDQVFSAETYNIENGLDLTAIKLSWSFPIVKKIKGYAQFFHGYGQSLTDYNVRTNSVGVGIALSDWL